MNSHYNKIIKPLARELRNSSTFGEVILWSKVLRAKQMLGYQFNRQFAMKIPSLQSNQFPQPPLQRGKEEGLDSIVDFICRKLKLIIETPMTDFRHTRA